MRLEHLPNALPGQVTDPHEPWEAHLELAYAARAGHTVPSLRRHRGPLRVQKHFAPEPGLCEHVIVHPPAGIAGGDRLHVDVDVGLGARARLTTPGATRWYRSAGPRASSTVEARVGQGGMLEYLPQEQIVFDGADALSSARFDLARGATLIAWDLIVLGRRAGDAPLSCGTWRSRLEVAVDDRLALAERAVLAADDAARRSPIGWAGKDTLATFVAVGPWVAAGRASPRDPASVPVTLIDSARAFETTAAVSDVEGLLVARCLADEPARARAWLEALWRLVRPALCAAPIVPPRIWRT